VAALGQGRDRQGGLVAERVDRGAAQGGGAVVEEDRACGRAAAAGGGGHRGGEGHRLPVDDAGGRRRQADDRRRVDDLAQRGGGGGGVFGVAGVGGGQAVRPGGQSRGAQGGDVGAEVVDHRGSAQGRGSVVEGHRPARRSPGAGAPPGPRRRQRHRHALRRRV